MHYFNSNGKYSKAINTLTIVLLAVVSMLYVIKGISQVNPVEAAIIESEDTTAITTTITGTTSLTTTTVITTTTTSNVSTTALSSSTSETSITEAIVETVRSRTTTQSNVSEDEKEGPKETDTIAIQEPEYIVFKESTHYIHRSTCRWYDSNCYEITDTNNIEARICTECNPEIEIVNEYIDPAPVTESVSIEEEIANTSSITTCVTEYERTLLAEIVHHEAGSDWITQYNKAKVAAGVMNRVYDARFPNDVYSVLTAPRQFENYWPGCCIPNQADYDAVDYYFAHQDEFNSDNSWYGDGYQNHFYYQ